MTRRKGRAFSSKHAVEDPTKEHGSKRKQLHVSNIGRRSFRHHPGASQENVFSSAPKLQVRKEHFSWVNPPQTKAKSSDCKEMKPDVSEAPLETPPDENWDVPSAYLVDQSFDMHSAARPCMTLSPYGIMNISCDCVVLLCNSLKSELARLFHIVWNLIPASKHLTHAFVREELYPWIEESCRYMAVFFNMLFEEVLPKLAAMCKPGQIKVISEASLLRETGKANLRLKAVVDSKFSFLLSLPPGERLCQLVFACTSLQDTVNFLNDLDRELLQVTFLLPTKENQIALKGLERSLWNKLIAAEPKAPSRARHCMRGMLSRWMNSRELDVCTQKVGLLPFLQKRKLQYSQELLTEAHGRLPDEIEKLMSHNMEEHIGLSTSTEKRMEWSSLIRLSRTRARDAEHYASEEEMDDASLHELYDFDREADSRTLRDIPSIANLVLQSAKTNTTGSF